MQNSIFIEEGPVFTRGALIEQGKIVELYLHTHSTTHSSLVGAIYVGRVKEVATHLQAAFIDLPANISAFLHVRHAQHRIGGFAEDGVMTASQLPIDSCVSEGEALFVQVRKDAHGDKGPQVTTDITLPGRYTVLAPARRVVTVSRHITDKKERKTLKRMGKDLQRHLKNAFGMDVGVVLRSAARGIDAEEIKQDLISLLTMWRQLLVSANTTHDPIALLPPDTAIHRLLRDHVCGDTQHITVSGARALQDVKAYLAEKMPDHLSKVQNGENAGGIDVSAIDACIETALATRVVLPSGGWISIEPTEALVAIDVNSGPNIVRGKGNTAFITNSEAAEEIARQLRLRRLGGVIIIDFIHMTGPQHGARQKKRLREILATACARDSAPVTIGAISSFGVLTMTRGRSEESLSEQLMTPSPDSTSVPRLSTLMDRAFRALIQELKNAPNERFILHINPDAAVWLEGVGKEYWHRLADYYGGRISWEIQRTWPRERFAVKPQQ